MFNFQIPTFPNLNFESLWFGLRIWNPSPTPLLLTQWSASEYNVQNPLGSDGSGSACKSAAEPWHRIWCEALRSQ